MPYHKVGEYRPPSGAALKTPPSSHGMRRTAISVGRPRRTGFGFEGPMVHVEKRQDKVLSSLVLNGDQWGRTQEMQGRLASDNRNLLRRSMEARREAHQELMASNPPAGWLTPTRTDREATWPGPIATRVPPHYQTTYSNFFNLARDVHKVPEKPLAVEERAVWSMQPVSDRATKEDDSAGRYPCLMMHAKFDTPGL